MTTQVKDTQDEDRVGVKFRHFLAGPRRSRATIATKFVDEARTKIAVGIAYCNVAEERFDREKAVTIALGRLRALADGRKMHQSYGLVLQYDVFKNAIQKKTFWKLVPKRPDVSTNAFKDSATAREAERSARQLMESMADIYGELQTKRLFHRLSKT